MERMWFYLHDNQQKGPVGQDELMRLLQQGFLGKDTSIWTEGMADWQPASTTSLTAEYAQTKPERPTCVKVFGILNIVFGGIGLLCTPLSIVAVFVPRAGSQTAMYSGAMNIYTLFSAGLGLILSCVLVAAGIGLLNRKRWARQTSYVYGWFSVVWNIIGFVIVLAILGSMLSSSDPQARMTAMSGVIGGACGGIIGFVYPIFLIVYMRKPHVIESCNR